MSFGAVENEGSSGHRRNMQARGSPRFMGDEEPVENPSAGGRNSGGQAF